MAEGLRPEIGHALTVIRLNMNPLSHYPDSPDRFSHHMDSLEQGVSDIERITNALRHFPTSSNPSGEIIDLVQILEQSATEAQQAQIEQRIHVRLQFNVERPAYTRGAMFQLIRAFTGIIENAIEANTQVSVNLPTQSQDVSVHVDHVDVW